MAKTPKTRTGYGYIIQNPEKYYFREPGGGTSTHKEDAYVYATLRGAKIQAQNFRSRLPEGYRFLKAKLPQRIDVRQAVGEKLHTGILTADPNKFTVRAPIPVEEALAEMELDAAPTVSLSEKPFMRPGKPDSARKETNPKDQVGVKKVPVHVIPAQVIGEIGLALLEGSRKYGSYNYRVAGVRASVYYDAVMARHMPGWWDGEDTDPDSGICHITKAIASLVVLRDAMMNDNWEDDRPPKAKNQNWVREQNAKAAALIERYPNCTPPYTELGTHTERS
jgi:hypothetical protein